MKMIEKNEKMIMVMTDRTSYHDNSGVDNGER